tara:strand:+ start:727 stop:1371 length:645 start_codon:yes stop_codon:yes gene_type:complete
MENKNNKIGEEETLAEYALRLNAALLSVQQSAVNKLYKEFSSRLDGSSSIYILGNGGSQANASHIVGDYMKTFALAGFNLKINCLSDNISYLTAASNDIDYSDVYSVLVGTVISENDLILYLSGSGNSINLVKCAQRAKSQKITQASITAFNGGRLKEIVNISLHVDIPDMEIAEDCQISIMHNLKQRLFNNFAKNKYEITPKYSKRILEDVVV